MRGSKTVTLDVRRISILSLCFVVLMTAVGFACLLFAASALGMPADHGMSYCGMPVESAAGCPHDESGDVATVISADSVPHILAAAASPSLALPPMLSSDVRGTGVGLAPEPPHSHLTPLRI